MLFFKKAFRWDYSCDLRRLSVLLHEANDHLFHKMVYNKDHCIHQLLPPEKIFAHETPGHQLYFCFASVSL